MAETLAQAPAPAAPVADEARTLAIIVYGLYLAAVISCGLAGIAGVILAYVKRGESHGTIWESHYDNQINAFWVWFALMILGAFTFWMLGLGFVIMGIAFVWFLYRTIKGLVRAIDSKPYA